MEKINKRRDLQQKLTEAKLQQANALLSEAEEKHKREKEYVSLNEVHTWKTSRQVCTQVDLQEETLFSKTPTLELHSQILVKL